MSSTARAAWSGAPVADAKRLLLLGGTGEAAALARRLQDDPRIHAVTSLAGRTKDPASLPGEVRVGGFGGPSGLARYLRGEAIDLVVDATHPFAAVMANNAAEACAAAAVPRLKLLRPAWQKEPGDRWIEVSTTTEAAATLPGLAERIFLTTGRRDLSAFAGLGDIWFLVRMIDPPKAPLPLVRHEVVLGRGPFGEADEIALLKDRSIGALVAKNSGGPSTYAKIAAARRLVLPVVMIARPDPPPGGIADGIEAALAWIECRLA